MTILADFRAGGRPRTKGSLNAYCRKNRQHSIRYEEEVEDSVRWRKIVARACREHQLERHGRFLQHEGAVEVRMVFFFPRERREFESMLWPTDIKLGDADKLVRNVFDALSMPRTREKAPVCSALILDDSQVVKASVAKFWSDADREPGVQVLVMEVEEPELELMGTEASWHALRKMVTRA